MILTEDIIVRYKNLTFKFKKGSKVEKKGDATYILPPGKGKKENIIDVVNEGIASNEAK